LALRWARRNLSRAAIATARPPELAEMGAQDLIISRMYADDLAQIEAGRGLYDAFCRWCRDAVEAIHPVL
jgi:hypothetical protein